MEISSSFEVRGDVPERFIGKLRFSETEDFGSKAKSVSVSYHQKCIVTFTDESEEAKEAAFNEAIVKLHRGIVKDVNWS